MDSSFLRFLGRLRLSATPASRRSSRSSRRERQKPAYRPTLEALEERTTPTTNISFDPLSHVLTLNVGANNETTTLSVTGTTLSVTSDSLIGTLADLNAILDLGFLPATPTGIANNGNIGAASPNDVW